MISRFRRLLVVLSALVALNPGRGFATEIKTRRGEVFSGVKIVGNDATSIEVTGPRGKFKIPRANIAEIDGIKVAAPAPTAAPGPAAPSPAATPAQPAAAPPASAAPSAARPIPSRAPSLILVMPTPAGVPVDGPLPGDPSASAAPATAGGENLPPPGNGEFAWDADWVRWTVAAVLALWIATLLLAWLELRGRPGKSRRWLYVAGLAPVLGYAVFLFATRQPAARKSRRGSAPSDKRVEFEFLDENGRPVMIKPGAEASGIQNAKDILNDALLDGAATCTSNPRARNTACASAWTGCFTRA